MKIVKRNKNAPSEQKIFDVVKSVVKPIITKSLAT